MNRSANISDKERYTGTRTPTGDDGELAHIYVFCKKWHFHPVKLRLSASALKMHENTPLGERTEIPKNYCWGRKLIAGEHKSAMYADRLRVPCPEVNSPLPSYSETVKIAIETETSKAQPRPQEKSEKKDPSDEFAKVFVVCKKWHFHPVKQHFSTIVLEMNENTPLGERTIVPSNYCWRRTLLAREHKKAESADRVRAECPEEKSQPPPYSVKDEPSSLECFSLSPLLEMQMNRHTVLLEQILNLIKNK